MVNPFYSLRTQPGTFFCLLLQEKKVQELIAKGDDSQNEHLGEIYIELEAIGAHSAEARARRILAVSRSLSVLCYKQYGLMYVLLYRVSGLIKKCSSGKPRNSLVDGE